MVVRVSDPRTAIADQCNIKAYERHDMDIRLSCCLYLRTLRTGLNQRLFCPLEKIISPGPVRRRNRLLTRAPLRAAAPPRDACVTLRVPLCLVHPRPVVMTKGLLPAGERLESQPRAAALLRTQRPLVRTQRPPKRLRSRVARRRPPRGAGGSAGWSGRGPSSGAAGPFLRTQAPSFELSAGT